MRGFSSWHSTSLFHITQLRLIPAWRNCLPDTLLSVVATKALAIRINQDENHYQHNPVLGRFILRMLVIWRHIEYLNMQTTRHRNVSRHSGARRGKRQATSLRVNGISQIDCNLHHAGPDYPLANCVKHVQERQMPLFLLRSGSEHSVCLLELAKRRPHYFVGPSSGVIRSTSSYLRRTVMSISTDSTSAVSSLDRYFTQPSKQERGANASNVTPSNPTLRDHFCARLLATRSLSMNSIVSAMTMLGIEAIGPLSLREIIFRTRNRTSLTQLLRIFKETGILVSRSRFSEAVLKLAFSEKAHMLRDVLNSDQHPEAFEDQQLQEKLLLTYSKAGDWVRTKQTLLILSFHHPQPEQAAWNALVKCHCSNADMQQLSHTLTKMRLERIQLTSSTILALQELLLRHDDSNEGPGAIRPRRSHRHSKETKLRVLANVFMSASMSGQELGPQYWHEILWGLGKTGQFKQLHKLALWLAICYGPKSADTIRLRYMPELAISSMYSLFRTPTPRFTTGPVIAGWQLQQIFSQKLLNEIVLWGFESWLLHRKVDFAARHGDSSVLLRADWACGLVLLQQLKRAGVYIPSRQVRNALSHCFSLLFGEQSWGKNTRRQVIRQRGPYLLARMMRIANLVWGERLFATRDKPPKRFGKSSQRYGFKTS